jgi:hypothetical protein
MSASASAKFTTLFRTALSNSAVSFQLFSTGGKGFGALGEVVKGLAGHADPLATIMDGLSKYLETFGKDNAAMYAFSRGSMEDFGWDADAVDPWTDLKETQLRAIAKRYRETREALSNLADYQSGGHWSEIVQEQPDFSSKFIRTVAPSRIEELKKYQVQLADAHEACRKRQDLKTCPLPQASEDVSLALNRWQTPPAPTINYSLESYGSSPGLVGSTVRSVLSAPDPLVALRGYLPQAEHLWVTMHLQPSWDWPYGTYLDTMKVTFVNADDGVERLVLTPGPAGSVDWARYPDNDPKRYESGQLDAFMASFSNGEDPYTGNGTFYLVVYDKFRRVFHLPLFDAKWTSQNGNLLQAYRDYGYY